MKISFLGIIKLSPEAFWAKITYHHVPYYRIFVHLAFLNSAVRQLLVLFRTFWCSIFVFVLLLLLLDDRNDVKEADFKPRFVVSIVYHDSYRVSGQNWGQSTPNGTFQAVFTFRY